MYEKPYYADENVQITNEKVLVGDQTFELTDIDKAKLSITRIDRFRLLRPLLLSLTGLGLVLATTLGTVNGSRLSDVLIILSGVAGIAWFTLVLVSEQGRSYALSFQRKTTPGRAQV